MQWPRGSCPQRRLASGSARFICQNWTDCRGLTLSIPNLITLARILLVPVVVWAIASNQMLFAFLLFAAAGVSDAVDGFLAKRFGMASELGAYLDPLADKVLIVSIYVSLGIVDALPRWLVILVVSRDLLIVGGVMFSWLIDKPVGVKPHPVSKANTAAQLLLVGLVLAALGFGFDAGWALTADHDGGRRADARSRSQSTCANGCATWAQRRDRELDRRVRRAGTGSNDAHAPDDVLGADARGRRPGAVGAARNPAAVRRRHGARLSARSARQPAGAHGRQPARRHAGDHRHGRAAVRAPASCCSCRC